MSLILRVSNISKNYNGKSVLTDCSFSFDSGGIYLLIGPNGTGKSTFLRVCALLEDPDRGEVDFFSGNDIVNKDINLRRRINLVLPKIGVFNTTVFKNAAYGLKIRGFNRGEIEERTNRVLDFVGLIQKKNLNALSLSSGETQRLGIARAIVLEPEVLFLDEPTASLDPYSTKIIEETITKIKEQKKLTIIMVTHNIFQAQRLADRVLFMYEGRIVDHGENREFFEKPKDERTYRFITGQMVY
jgi:tungstate transport system ATP-binding protein